jgi:hypothetical protein
MKPDCDCGCNNPIFSTPEEAIRFLANRFNYAGVSDAVAKYYARDLNKIIETYYGHQNETTTS